MAQHPSLQPLAPSHADIPPPEALTDPSALASVFSNTSPSQNRFEDKQRASPNPAIREALFQAQAGEGGAIEMQQAEGDKVQDWGWGQVGEDGLLRDGARGKEIALEPSPLAGFPTPHGSLPLPPFERAAKEAHLSAEGTNTGFQTAPEEGRAGPLQPEDHLPRVYAGEGGRGVRQANLGGLGSSRQA